MKHGQQTVTDLRTLTPPDPITQSLYWCLVCLVLSTTYFVIMWGGKKGTSADHGLLL